ncbi:MAG: type II secretion system protein [Halarcobacter ebronensis]|uniref:type II secretion system protein n=1 Tax=Halarcobacter ebronensis TaxID=1462615 RepID=UPI003C71CC17
MNCQNKKAFSLLELIFVVFVGSIIIVYSTIYSKEYYEAQTLNQELAIIKLDLDSAKIIVEKNLPSSIDDLKYSDNTLYFKNSTLLENVNYYSLRKLSSNILEIEVEVDEKIKQKWNFKL